MRANYTYQKEIVSWLSSRVFNSDKDIVLAAAPGAGKTDMVIQFLIKEKKRNLRTVIIAHNQIVLRSQWADRLREYDVDFMECLSANKMPEKIPPGEVMVTLAGTLGFRKEIEIPECDLLIFDEAHQYFLADRTKEILKRFNQKYSLLLTGSPSKYINNEKYEIRGITVSELLKFGVITDPHIELVESKNSIKYSDLDEKMELKKGKLTNAETQKTLSSVFAHLSNRSKDPGKTMIVCSDSVQAHKVHEFFESKKINSILCISLKVKYDPEYRSSRKEVAHLRDQIHTFKTDPDCDFIIVIKRAVLGFDFPDLKYVYDLSFSHNPDRIFQLLCRVVRSSKSNTQKFYFKVTSEQLAPLTYFVMNFTVALSVPEYYYSYSIGLKQRSNMRTMPVAVKKEFLDKVGKDLKFPDLPSLLTFSDYVQRSGDVKTFAKATLAQVIAKCTHGRESWSEDRLRELMASCKNRKEFTEKFPTAAHAVLRINKGLLEEFYGKLKRHTEESVLSNAKSCKSRAEFIKKFCSDYSWAKKNKKLSVLDAVFGNPIKVGVAASSKGSSNIDAIVDMVVRNDDYTVDKWGNLFYKGNQRRLYNKKGYPVFKVNECSVPAAKIVYRKVFGPIPDGYFVRQKDKTKGLWPDNLTLLPNNQKNIHMALTRGSKAGVGNVRFSEDVVRKIKQDRTEGAKYPDLVKKYKIAKSTLSYILNKKKT